MLQLIPNYDLQALNTLAVPASASCFAEIRSTEDLAAALRQQQSIGLPLMVLGGGSNVVLRGDFPGMVLQMAIPGIEEVGEDEKHVWVRVGAGENWHRLVQYCLDFHYWGLENLSLIPGSVGAAPVQNIGAYGVELKDVFAELQAMEVSSGVLVNFDREGCGFAYRDSVFKRHLRDKYVITSVTLKLSKTPELKLDYPALREALAGIEEEALTSRMVSDAVCAIRRAKLPDPAVVPNVGSFFKNPVVDAEKLRALQEQFPDLVAYPLDQRSAKLAAGWLIDNIGWRGYSEGNVGVHPNQALVLVNPGKGQGSEVLQLAEKIQKAVREQYGVELEMEPRVYP